MAGPWYRDGLQFRCTECGECCKRAGDIFLRREEADRIADRVLPGGGTAETLMGELWVEDLDGRLRIEVLPGEVCPLLGADERCTVHDIKPSQCATYPFWPETLTRERAWRYEGRHCEGIDQGPRYAVEQIVALKNGSGRTQED